MLKLGKWMEVIQNPEAFADSSSVSVSLSLVGCCGRCLLVALHMCLFLHLQFLRPGLQCRLVVYVEMVSGRKTETRETNQNKYICD